MERDYGGTKSEREGSGYRGMGQSVVDEVIRPVAIAAL